MSTIGWILALILALIIGIIVGLIVGAILYSAGVAVGTQQAEKEKLKKCTLKPDSDVFTFDSEDKHE